MNPVVLTLKEIGFRWKTCALIVLIIAAITGVLAYLAVNNAGFQKEISRNARDIGSNVVILPAEVDQFQYHHDGGFSDQTMPSNMVEQLLQHKPSLNHLIPMLEQKAICSTDGKQSIARIVGISASIPMPGRPKAPMQKSIEKREVQLGSGLAEKLGIQPDQTPEIKIGAQVFGVSRVNRSNGTWQDSAAFLDLETAQSLFNKPDQISRIEAIECTQEQCERTGLKSDDVLANELARITDQAVILRRDAMANARSNIRVLSQANLSLLQNVLWVMLTIIVIAVAMQNSIQRQSEIGVLQAVGFGQFSVSGMVVMRSILLTLVGAGIGVAGGSLLSHAQSRPLFETTGKKFEIDWQLSITIGLVAVVISMLASAIPAWIAASRHPADIIGREN